MDDATNPQTDPSLSTPTPDENHPAAYPPDPADDKPPELPPSVDSGGTRALYSLLRATPFLDLHKKAGGKHPVRGWVCFASDFLVRLIVLILMIGIIGAVVWKTLAPLPEFWQH